MDEKASNYVTVEFAEDGTDGQKEAMIEIADRQTNDMPAEKSAMKKYLDRMLYKKLSEQSGRTLAWGILMGVRPTKIAMRKLEEGMTQETFVPWFQKENLVSEEKAHLACTFGSLRYAFGGDHPSQTTHQAVSAQLRVRPQTAKGPYFKDGSTKASAPASKPPAYPTHRMTKVNAKL